MIILSSQFLWDHTLGNDAVKGISKMFAGIIESRRRIGRNIAIVSFTLLLSACRTAPIYNAENVPISPRSSATDEQISEAIWFAGRRLEWRIDKVKPGEMRGVFRKRAHAATVTISYDRTQFSILYKDSENFDYDGSNIHVNYNVWIQRLADQIQKEIGFRLP